MDKKLIILSLLTLPAQAMDYWVDTNATSENTQVIMYNYETEQYSYGARNEMGGIHIYETTKPISNKEEEKEE